ncbi:MAG: hypothetical protein ACHQQP_05510 [Gemmatimonadales bacterium]
MTDSESLDIRYPIGGLFLVLGALLVPYGWFVESARTPIGSNIDLWWGVVMLVFGVLLLSLARAARLRDARAISNTEPSNRES